MEERTDRVDDVVRAWRRELPEVVGNTTELAKRLTQLSTALGEATRRELAAFELTVAQYDVLAALRRAGAPFRMKPSHLVGELLLSSGGAAKTLKQLAARRLVERESDVADGRVAWVRLSAEGVDLAERVVRATSGAQQELFRHLPAEAAEHATAALREVCAAVDDGRPRGPF